MELIFTNDFSLERSFKKEQYITKLENTILKYNRELLTGYINVDDATYTNCIELLTMLCPDSPLLENEKHVNFIKGLNEDSLSFIEEKVIGLDSLKFYLNPQGLNVRLVYEYGELVEATTFGRSFKNMDVIELMSMIMTNRNDYLDRVEHVEIEGTLVLSIDNIDMASQYCTVYNAYQGVFSFIDYLLGLEEDFEENLEEIVWFIATDVKSEEIPFGTIESKYDFLVDNGFEIPDLIEIERGDYLVYDLETALEEAEKQQSEYSYLTDGFRLLTNSDDVVIFKLGHWEISYSEAVVEKIKWVDEKGRKLPLLQFKEPVKIMESNLIESESYISEMLLSNISLLLILDIIEQESIIRLAYFGGMGLLPITKNNEIILN